MILAGGHAGPEHLARFRSEAKAVARLQHPHIVQIYEVGEQDGRPYFSLELVDGDTLDRKLAGTPLPARQAAALVETLARAVQAAHERGIIHRDLKPANVLLMADGTPKITDFGLAKHLDRDGTQTGSDAILGTPCYMAPEQASGKSKEVGPPADIYSLGAILYELLTGRPPFKGPSVLDTLEQVRSQEPVSPSHLQPQLPHDLETICLKCLEKEPSRRYATAGALAEELRRFLSDEPILARPIGVWGRGLKWARRRPAVAGLLTTLALVIAGGLAAMTTLWLRAEEQRNAATAAKALAEQQRDEAREAKEDAYKQRAAAEKANGKLDEQVVRLCLSNGLQLLQEGDLLGSLPAFAEALRRDLKDAQRDPKRQEVHRLRLAAILAHCPRLVQLWSHGKAVHCAAFSPDGSRVVTGDADGAARIWDVITGQPVPRALLKHSRLVQHVSFSSDGRLLVTGSLDKTARLWNAETGQAIGVPLQHGGAVRRAVFSPDNQRILTASDDGKARLWHVGAQKPSLELEHDAEVWDAAFSPDGSRIVTASLDHTARVWDASTGKGIGRALEHNNQVWHAAFSPNGRQVVTASWDWTAQVWDVETGERIAAPLKHDGEVIDAVFSPDGQRVLTASLDHTARTWDVATGHMLMRLEHTQCVNLAVFSPDGRRVLTASEDETAMVWDATTGRPLTPPLKHESRVTQAAFSPDGHLVLTASEDRTARLWDITPDHLHTPFLRHAGRVNHVVFSADGRRVATASDDRTARVWDVATGQPVSPPLRHDGKVFRALFSPDSEGRWVITASADGTARVWNALTGQPVTPPLEHGAPVWSAAFSPDGRRVATADANQGARVWDVATGKPLTPLLKHGHGGPRVPVEKIKPPKEGRKTGKESDRQELQGFLILSLLALQDVQPPPSEQPVTPVQPAQPAQPAALSGGPTGLSAPVGDGTPDPDEPSSLHSVQVAFSPDGRRLVTTALGQTAQVWDLADPAIEQPKPFLTLRHTAMVWHAEFSPDGTHLLTAAGREALIWEVATGKPSPPMLLRHTGLVSDASYSRDGQYVVTASADRTTQVWWAATGEPLMLAWKHAKPVLQAVFTPDGRRVLTRTADEARVWDTVAGQPLTPPLRHGGLITSMAISPDARRVVTAGWDRAARVWVLPPPDDRPTDDLLLLAELLGNRTIDDSGDFVPSEPTVLSGACQTLRSRYPTAFASSLQQQLAWHRREADDSERQAICEGLGARREPSKEPAKPLPPGEGDLQVAPKKKHAGLAVHWFAADWHYTRLIVAEPANSTWYYRRGRARAELGDWTHAWADFAKAIRLSLQ
jgi:WD40 repeat protein